MKLEISEITKYYRSKTAVEKIKLNFETPGLYSLLGANGAGKSTLMKIIAGLTEPTTGYIVFENENKKGYRNLKKVLGYLPQDFGVYEDLTAIEFLEYIGALKGVPGKECKRRIPEILKYLNIFDSRNKKLGKYSGGMKQRIGIAQALLNNPKVLLLDEPTVGLDPSERNNFKNLLSEMSSDKIILLSTHIVSDIENISDLIIMIDSGKIIKKATPSDLLKEIKNIVWETDITKEEEDFYEKKYNIVHKIKNENGFKLRIVSDENPEGKCINTLGNIEDSYFYYIKNKNKKLDFFSEER